MKSNRSLISFLQLLLCACFLVLPSLAMSQDEIKQPHVRAQLLSEHTSVTPGISELFALRLIPDPSWHLYWKYPGDSGAAPILTWLIDGHSLDAPLSWPTPEKIEVGSFVNYGYAGEVLLFAELPIPEESTDSVTIGLDAEWLVCKEECIPGNGFFALTLPVRENHDATVRSESASLFEQFLRRIPRDSTDLSLKLSHTTPETLTLTMPTPSTLVESLTFIPGAPGIIQNNAPQVVSTDGPFTQLTLLRDKAQPLPEIFHGVLISTPPFEDGSTGKTVQIPLSTLNVSENTLTSGDQESLLLILISALVGGLILNLMPCVFPVLAIKVLSFVNKAGKDSHLVRRHGLSFGFGVLASFWILATLIRGLRQAGESLGWGFQLQNPSFVAILILLMLAVALNLFGVFEFGTSLQRISSGIEGPKQEGYFSSFLSGVLATVLATPCTAPFMGSAIAYGIQVDFLRSLLVFTMLGIGLAAPYVLLSFRPQLLSSLPKPGEWMETFKQLMGFPVLLTVLWLLWVFEKQSSSEALLSLLLASILLAFSLWIFGRFFPPTSSKKRMRWGLALLALLLALTLGIGLPQKQKTSQQSITIQLGHYESEIDSYGLRWTHFSPELMKELQQRAIPTYVDFTAAWCVTCQVNKKLIFGSGEMRALFQRKGVALVKADWTTEDPLITETLQSFQRAGVPLNILYTPRDWENPYIFPTVLTRQMMREQLKQLPDMNT